MGAVVVDVQGRLHLGDHGGFDRPGTWVADPDDTQVLGHPSRQTSVVRGEQHDLLIGQLWPKGKLVEQMRCEREP